MNLSEIRRMFPIMWNAFRRNSGVIGYTPKYKVYTLHLSHVSGNPTQTVHENTLGATITWTQENPGSYEGTLSANVLTEGKTYISYNVNLPTAEYTFHVQRNHSGLLGVSFRQNGTGAGGFEADIEIRVYN